MSFNQLASRKWKAISLGLATMPRSTCSATRVIQAAAVCSVGVSLTAIFGLIAGHPIFDRWDLGARGMVLDSALGALMAGIGLWLAQRKNQPALRWVAISLLLIGAINLFVWHVRGILQQIFFPHDPMMQMSLATTTAFLLMGAALLLVSGVNARVSAVWVVAILGAIISSIGLITLLGYVWGLRTAPWWAAFFLQMALPTAAAFCALGIGLIAFCFQSAVVQRFSLTLVVFIVMGFVLLLAGVGAIAAGSHSVVTALSEIRMFSRQMGSLETLVQDIRLAESGQRGYLLTGDKRYLQAFRDGQRGCDDVVRTRSGLDAKLIELMHLKFDELNRTIVLENLGQHEAALRLVESSLGWRLMQDIDARADTSANLLRTRLSLLTDGSQQSLISVRKAVFWSCGTAILFAASSLLLIVTEMRRRSFVEVDLRNKEASLQEQTLRAQQANSTKSSFLASMSHEIRTPMIAIVGFADMLLHKNEGHAARMEWAEIIQRNAKHLLEIINDILDLSKVEAGEMRVELISCDLPVLLAEINSLMRPRAAEKGLDFGVTFQGPIPRLIQSDPSRLRQILINLLGNAIKFTASGKIGMRVTEEEIGAPGIVLRVDVIDSGMGMTPEVLERLFRPFTQGDESITRKFGGTGLGLAISQQLARLLGGDVTVTSRPNIGSTFTLTIDGGPSAGVERVEGLTEATLPAKVDQHAPNEIHLRGRILLAEDGADNQRLLQMQLTSAGASVMSAINGKIAVELATTHAFDLILMDMQMPVMDGYTATRELRHQGLTIPIIALTAYAMAEDRDKCVASGCTAYLSKPADEEALLALVNSHLELDRSPSPSDSSELAVA